MTDRRMRLLIAAAVLMSLPSAAVAQFKDSGPEPGSNGTRPFGTSRCDPTPDRGLLCHQKSLSTFHDATGRASSYRIVQYYSREALKDRPLARYGLLLADGTTIVAPKYTAMRPVSPVTAFVRREGGDWALLDLMTGEERPFQPPTRAFVSAKHASFGTLLFYHDLTVEGKKTLSNEYFQYWLVNDRGEVQDTTDVWTKAGTIGQPKPIFRDPLGVINNRFVLRVATDPAKPRLSRLYMTDGTRDLADREVIADPSTGRWAIYTNKPSGLPGTSPILLPLGPNAEPAPLEPRQLGFIALHPDPLAWLEPGVATADVFEQGGKRTYRINGRAYDSLETFPDSARLVERRVAGRTADGWRPVNEPSVAAASTGALALAAANVRWQAAEVARLAEIKTLRASGDRAQMIADFETHWRNSRVTPDGTTLWAKAVKLGGPFLERYAETFAVNREQLRAICQANLKDSCARNLTRVQDRERREESLAREQASRRAAAASANAAFADRLKNASSGIAPSGTAESGFYGERQQRNAWERALNKQIYDREY